MELVPEIEMFRNLPYEQVDLKSENPKSLFELGKNLAVYARDAGGIGLAAPQVGIYRQICVYQDDGNNYVMALNPMWVAKGSKTKVQEGCLTSGDERKVLRRYKSIKAKFWTFDKSHKPFLVEWSLKGSEAIIFQHEVDHLRGYILGEHLSSRVARKDEK